MAERADLGYNEGNKEEVELSTSARKHHMSRSRLVGWYKSRVAFDIEFTALVRHRLMNA